MSDIRPRKAKLIGPARSARRIVLAFATLAVFLTSAGAAQAAFGPTGSFGNYGTGAGQLVFPYDVATYDSFVYVTEPYTHRVTKFTSTGQFVLMWGRGVRTGAAVHEICTSVCHAGSPGSGAGEFYGPAGVATDDEGNVYVADQLNNRVQKFDADGNFIATFGWGVDTGATAFEICTAATPPCHAGIWGTGSGQFTKPIGLDIRPRVEGPPGETPPVPQGTVYVVDYQPSNRVQMFKANGAYLDEWGGSGSGNGQFNDPIDVAIDAEGKVWVTDWFNGRIQKFTANGFYQGQLGGLDRPSGVASHAGRVYFLEPFKYRVDALRLNGNQMGTFGWGVNTGASTFQVCIGGFTGPLASCQTGLLGAGPGQLYNPFGIDTDRTGNVYVADSRNNRIQRFGN